MSDPYSNPQISPPPPPQGYEPAGAPLNFAPPTPPQGSAGGAANGGGWPGAAKFTAILLGALLIAGGVVAFLLVRSAKQDADDSKAALSAVNESLSDLTDQADSDADSVKDQIDALLDQQATDKTTQQQLQATIADLNEQITTLTNQVANGATGGGEDVAALQTQLEQARQDLADVQAQLTETQDDLDEALANANTTAAPFDVEAGKVPLGGGNFSVVTNRVTCDGYADAASSCPDTFTVDGRIFSEGDGYVIEFANIARVSMGSFDGFNYGGQAPATGDVSPTCNGNPVATTFAVQIAPVRYHVDPATQAVSSTAFSFTWTMSAPAGGGCAATTRVYTGTIAL